ncbi:MAG: hypothetical protein C4584_01425 [Armatimonadetes bacterium]|nr:MAG: hypothetical protein C4584_01425 [Armatimonadota bacterium]
MKGGCILISTFIGFLLFGIWLGANPKFFGATFESVASATVTPLPQAVPVTPTPVAKPEKPKPAAAEKPRITEPTGAVAQPPAPAKKLPPQVLWGSCTVVNSEQRFNANWTPEAQLRFDFPDPALYARLNELHKSSGVLCYIEPSSTGFRVLAAGTSFDIPPGEPWGFPFEAGDFEVGFLATPGYNPQPKAPQPAISQPPAQPTPTAVPAPTATPAPPQLALTGYVRVVNSGEKIQLTWIPELKRLMLSNEANAKLNELHKSSPVEYWLDPNPRGATIEALGKLDIQVPANERWNYTLPSGNFNVGFAAVMK